MSLTSFSSRGLRANNGLNVSNGQVIITIDQGSFPDNTNGAFESIEGVLYYTSYLDGQRRAVLLSDTTY